MEEPEEVRGRLGEQHVQEQKKTKKDAGTVKEKVA